MEINKDIVPIKKIWTRDSQEDILFKVKNFFEKSGFKKVDADMISSTKINLIWWLTPSYSPLYKNWQLEIHNSWLSNEWDKLEPQEMKVTDFLKNKYYMRGSINNKTTLISQFSGIMIKNLLLNNDGNFYLIDRLFRSTHKDYTQIECGTIGYNLGENIDIMLSLLSDLYWEDFEITAINENFFYFTSPAFEFHCSSKNRDIILAWGFVDGDLVSEFDKEKKTRFLFGVKLDKLATENYNNKHVNDLHHWIENQWKWKIKFDKKRIDKLKMLEKYLQIDIIETEDYCYISPCKLTRLDIFRKDVLSNLLDYQPQDELPMNKNEINVSITENTIKLQWKWKDLFYEALPRFLEKYYWGEIKQYSDDSLELFFPNFSPLYLKGIFDFWECDTSRWKIIRVSKLDILNILGQNQNPIDSGIMGKIEKKGYSGCELVDNDYIFHVNKERTDINTSWDILWDLFGELSTPIKMKKQPLKESDNKFVDLSSTYLINTWYSQIYPWSIIWAGQKSKDVENFLWSTFWSVIAYWNNKRIYNTFLPYLLSEIKLRNSRYPRKFFIKSKTCSSLWDATHICCSHFIKNEDFWKFNDFFSDIVTILSPTGQQKVSLEILEDNNLFRTGNGFYLCLNWKKIWFIWILDTEQHNWIKGFWMFAEFMI